MKIDRAIEILNPEHREHYESIDPVNEACRMGMEALERTRWIPVSERLPKKGKYVLLWSEDSPGWLIWTGWRIYGRRRTGRRFILRLPALMMHHRIL